MQKNISKNEYIGDFGVKYTFEYFECESFDDLPRDKIKQCYAVAFNGNKMVIVHNGKKDTWGLVGGSVEKGEDPNDTLIREIKEESNMKVLSYQLIGCQKVVDSRKIQQDFYQLRYFSLVEPYGPFDSDPDLTIDKMLEVDPIEYKKYFDWGEIGDAIIKKAVELKKNHLPN